MEENLASPPPPSYSPGCLFHSLFLIIAKHVKNVVKTTFGGGVGEFKVHLYFSFCLSCLWKCSYVPMLECIEMLTIKVRLLQPEHTWSERKLGVSQDSRCPLTKAPLSLEGVGWQAHWVVPQLWVLPHHLLLTLCDSPCAWLQEAVGSSQTQEGNRRTTPR